MDELSKRITCDAYEEVDKLAKDAWERLKRAHKKKANLAVEEAIKDFSEAMELVYEVWPTVVEEFKLQVDNSATETAVLAGYYEAKSLLPDADRKFWISRGDHVATRTLYKASRMWP